ncbi:MAG: S8 family serine peptidase [Gaiellaceae bacterium]
MIRSAAAAAAASLVLAAPAGAARFAIGVDRSAPLRTVAARLSAYGRVSFELAKLHVLVVRAPRVRGVRRIDGVRWVEWLGSRRRRLAFTPTDPLFPKQWYVPQDHAFDFWPDLPVLPSVKVAVVDSGIDVSHPDLVSKILLARSFVGGTVADLQGHGTFVAGEIAASLNNNEGIAGIAFPAQLLIAKVVQPDGTVSLEAEAQAIRWAVDSGARVINLSLGGVRDPRNPSIDTYSPLEAAAVDYAVAKGAVVVASVGNSDQAPQTPWPYASWPAALPHVIGVGALARDGSVPLFSDRDDVFVDLAAPGQDILSTLPRALTKDASPACLDQGYSDCGPDEFKHAEGTSFAAPQVAAAAALLIAENPLLTNDQVGYVLERTADDVNASNGCTSCPLLRDFLTGWGRLDIAKALAIVAKGALPPRDHYETNDDLGRHAFRIYGRRRAINATIDYWDDPVDVYRVKLVGGQKLAATLDGPARTSVLLALWSPDATSLSDPAVGAFRVKESRRPGAHQHLTFRVPVGSGGLYNLEVQITQPGSGPYSLTFSKS